MASFEEVSDGEPPVIDPYEVLGLERSATADQVKSAYRKAALKHHPDKVPEDQKSQAHEKFQSIAFAYAILSDESRRKRYDTTGSTAESIVDADGFSWSDFYRGVFADAVNVDAIAEFSEKYKGSDEEKNDVLAAYEEFDGDMEGVYESVILSDVLEDDKRFRAIINVAIEAGDVPGYTAYTHESKKSKRDRVKRAGRERQEAEEYAKELGVHDKLFGKADGGGDKKNGGGTTSKGKGKGTGKGNEKDDRSSEDALAALIRKNQADRGTSFLDQLAEKYGAKKPSAKKKKGKRKAEDEDEDEEEPSEEVFQAAAARLEKRKAAAETTSIRPKRSKR